jgi:hypothetical protein
VDEYYTQACCWFCSQILDFEGNGWQQWTHLLTVPQRYLLLSEILSNTAWACKKKQEEKVDDIFCQM